MTRPDARGQRRSDESGSAQSRRCHEQGHRRRGRLRARGRGRRARHLRWPAPVGGDAADRPRVSLPAGSRQRLGSPEYEQRALERAAQVLERHVGGGARPRGSTARPTLRHIPGPRAAGARGAGGRRPRS